VKSLFTCIKDLWNHLEKQRQRQFGLLMALMVISAFAEMMSLGAVLPFLGVLTAPDRIFRNPFISRLASSWHILSPEQLVFPITVAFVIAALVAGVIRMRLLYCSTRLAFAAGADLSSEVYRRTLYQPYAIHVARNSSGVISGITFKVAGSVNVLYNLLTLFSSAILIVTIAVTLILVDPVIAFTAIAGFGIAYGLIGWISRHKLRINSERIAHEQTQVLKALQEGLGGIRDVLLDGTQPIYCDIYRQADHPLRRAEGGNLFIAGSPRFIMEAFGMIMIAGLAYGLSRQPGGGAAALPILGALAFGAQRLLPALQAGYNSWASIAGNHAALADALDLLEQPVSKILLQPRPSPLGFALDIRFHAVGFRYSESTPWVLRDFTLTIPKGVRVGFVGTTGSGKSTTLDLLMGLLQPTEGEILVDGSPITGARVRGWQQTLAHVPQSIYLTDATLAENIAFGIPRDKIDMDRVRAAARQAQISDFVESRAEGYNAMVGERGVRLSGGQRQRIGIARALYKKATVLVFDEATSALDSATEKSVMDSIEGLDRSITILIIAHRLSTVRRCDTIVELEHGRVVAEGSYDTLLNGSESFQRMVKVAKYT